MADSVEFPNTEFKNQRGIEYTCTILLLKDNDIETLFPIKFSSVNNIRYVHRSRHFNDDAQSANMYESSTSINKSEYFTHNSHKSSASSSSSLNNSNPFNLRCHSRSMLQKRRVTIILIFCLFVALLLWTPQSLSLTYETLIESYSKMSHKHRIILLIFNNFANLFVCINASIDFILYCFLSEKFARTCKQIIFRQCSNHKNINGQHPRLLSIDRTSTILANPSNNIHQQKLAANTTNKYYIQLYDFYRNSSGYKINSDKKWKKKFVRSITTNTKIDKHIFYQKTLIKNKQKQQLSNKPIHIISNPILEHIDEDDINNETNESMNTLMTNLTKQSRSGTVTYV